MVILDSTRQSANTESLVSSRTRDNRHASSIARYTKTGDTGKRVASNQTQYDTRKHAQTESYQASRRFELVVVHLSTSTLEHPRISHLTYIGRYSCLCFFLVQSLTLQIQAGSSRFLSKREIDVEYRHCRNNTTCVFRQVLKHLSITVVLLMRNNMKYLSYFLYNVESTCR